MEITDVRLNLIKQEGPSKAIGSIELDKSFAVRGVKVVERKDGGLFVSFPQRDKGHGEYEDIAYPCSKEFYAALQERVLHEYQLKKDLEAIESQSQDRAAKETQTQEVAKEKEVPQENVGKKKGR